MQPTSTRLSHRNHWLLDMTFLMTMITFFYLLWLGAHPLFTPDEGRYSEVAREMVASGDYITPTENGVVFLDKPILFYWLQSLAIHFFGLKEWTMRLWPALFGVFGCLMTYAAGRILFDRYTALIAAAILACSPLYFGSAHYTNLDMELAIWISASLFAFITAMQSSAKLRHYLLFAAYGFSALAMLTKGLIGLVFPILICSTWIALLKRWDLLKKIHLPLGMALIFAIVLPWYLLVEKANPGYLYHFFVNEQISRFLSTHQFNNKSPVWFFIPILIIGFFPWSIFLIQTLYQTIRLVIRTRAPVELFLLLWTAIIFIFFSIPHSKIVTYILPIFPPLALLTGRYWVMHWKNTKQSAGIVLFFLISLVLMIGCVTQPYYHWIAMSDQIKPYLISMIIIFSLSAIASLFALNKKNLLLLFSICLLCSISFLLTFISSASELNLKSTKSLAIKLNTLLTPEDVVMTYYDYPLDLPFYLNRHVAIVENWHSNDIIKIDNWTRELWRGMRFRNTEAFLISKTTFKKRWDGSKRVFVVTDVAYLKDFNTKPYYILAKSNDMILISNIKPDNNLGV